MSKSNNSQTFSLSKILLFLIFIGGLFYCNYQYIFGTMYMKVPQLQSKQENKTLVHFPSPNQGSVMLDSSVLIVVGTNRLNSLSTAVAHYYADLLNKKGQPVQILELSSLPSDFIKTALYENRGKNQDFNQERTKMEKAKKYVFIVPEYNGSFPGVLKAFLDGLDFPITFTGKKCALIGVSKGWRGGSAALSHLTDIFHYLKMDVHPFKVCLPNIIDGRIETILTNLTYKYLLEEHAEAIIHY